MKGRLIGGSPWFKLFVVFAMVIASTAIFLMLGTLSIPLFFDIPLTGLLEFVESPGFYERVDILLFLQGLTTIGTFMIPALVGAYLISPYPSDYLGIQNFPKKGGIIVLLLIILTLGGTVISDTLYKISMAIPFPEALASLKEYLDSAQGAMQDQMASFLDMQSPMDFVMVLFVMAVLPALCEETLFRGILQPLVIRGLKNTHWGIILSSILFGVLHQQFYSFLSIFALSIVLGYLKFWTKSLWVPIIMHFFNNASIVVAIYFFNVSLDDVSGASTGWDLLYIFGGVLVFSLSLWGINKLSSEKEKGLV